MGNYRWFLVRFNPLHDDKGQVRRWYVALTDIEDRKQAEDTLRRENVALRRRNRQGLHVRRDRWDISRLEKCSLAHLQSRAK